eukprot:s36_g12.t1
MKRPLLNFLSALRTYYAPALDASRIRSSLTTKPKSQCRGLCSLETPRFKRLVQTWAFKPNPVVEAQAQLNSKQHGSKTAKTWIYRPRLRRTQCLNQIRRPPPLQQKTRPLLAPQTIG